MHAFRAIRPAASIAGSAAASQLGTASAGLPYRPLPRGIWDTSALDFRQARVGQHIEIPYEITIDESWRTVWHSTFYQHDRLYTSKPFARSMGFEALPLPYSLLLFQTGTSGQARLSVVLSHLTFSFRRSGSMSHLDDFKEVLDLGYRHAVYERPAYPGSTFRKAYLIKGLRPTHQDTRTVVTVQCDLFNVESKQRVFSVDKNIVYPEPVHHTQHVREAAHPPAAPRSHFLADIRASASVLHDAKGVSVSNLETGQLILHGHSRPIGTSSVFYRLILSIAAARPTVVAYCDGCAV